MGFGFDKSSQDGSGGGKVRRQLELDDPAGPYSTQTNPSWRLTDKDNNSVVTGTRLFNYGIGSRYDNLPPSTSYRYSFSLTSSEWMDILIFASDSYSGQYNVSPSYINVNGNTLTTDEIILGGNTGFPSNPYVGLDIYGYGNTVTVGWYNPNTFTANMRIATAIAQTVVSSGGSIQWPPAMKGKSVYRDTL